MRFIIRHQKTELEEEVYEFEIIHDSIKYVGFWNSKRLSLELPFGYDWDKYYSDQKFKELSYLDKIYGSWEDIDEYDYDHPKYVARKSIFKKYSPIEQKVLYGSYSNSMRKEHPPLVGNDEIMKTALEHVSKLKIC